MNLKLHEKKLIVLFLLTSILSIIHVSAQSGLWQSYSGSSGSIQTLLSETSDKALKIEIQRILGDSFSIGLYITSDEETYTERFLSQSEEFVSELPCPEAHGFLFQQKILPLVISLDENANSRGFFSTSNEESPFLRFLRFPLRE